MGKLGFLLILVGVGGLFFMLSPLFLTDNQPVLNILEPLLCAPDEKLTLQVITASYRPGETSVSGDYDCLRPDETSYDVTDKAFLLGAAAFLVPFLFGLFMTIAAFNRAVRGVIPTRTVEFGSGWNQPDMSTSVSQAIHSMSTPSNTAGFGAPAPASTGGETELTKRLKQLRDAYDSGMISNEEYERTKADLLKDFSNVD